MIKKEEQYFNINRMLLFAVGLWPYKQSNFTKFQHIFISAILTAFIIFQLTTLTVRYTLELFMNVLASASFFSLFIIKYYAFCFNIEDLKDLLMQLERAHNELTDKNEIAIIKKYDCISRRYAIGLITLGVCVILGGLILQFWLHISEIDSSKNASRSRDFLFTMEYFIDQETYYYLILLHIITAICIGPIILIATGTTMIAYIHHSCGIFRIANYRIKHAINFNTRQNVTPKNKILMTESIICAIDIHRQAMKLTKHFMSVMETMTLCMIICGVACLTFNLFQIASFKSNMQKFLIPFTFASTCILYMFLANRMGQIITDHNNHIFTTAYNVQWYKTPLHIQRMILFLLQRRTKEFTLNVGGLFDASMECFAILVKASLSYFTVIYSTR